MANPGCGCSCWALPRSPFALFLCWMAKRISGWGICVSPFAVCVCFCLFLCYDLPTYMTTGVHVDVVLTCFFSCKDRASERYRPHRRKKKVAAANWRFKVLRSSFSTATQPRPAGLRRTTGLLHSNCMQSSVHGSRRFHDVKVHLAMAPVAVMLNPHADALTAVCNWKYQRRRPTTGIKVVAHFSPPFGATAVGLTQRAPTAYPLWSKPHCTWPHQCPADIVPSYK